MPRLLFHHPVLLLSVFVYYEQGGDEIELAQGYAVLDGQLRLRLQIYAEQGAGVSYVIAVDLYDVDQVSEELKSREGKPQEVPF